MRVVIQRVSYAKVTVEQKVVGSIDHGYMLLVGIAPTDDDEILHKVAKK